MHVLNSRATTKKTEVELINQYCRLNGALKILKYHKRRQQKKEKKMNR